MHEKGHKNIDSQLGNFYVDEAEWLNSNTTTEHGSKLKRWFYENTLNDQSVLMFNAATLLNLKSNFKMWSRIVFVTLFFFLYNFIKQMPMVFRL